MKKPTIKPTDHARDFNVDELFYSTTSAKGIIETGNDVFYRVAGYDEAALIGQPHNIIRHPDMPRAAFQLFWEHLQARKPVAVYVKNMANDGGYYWVLALAAPIEGGFVSVRSKPCSAVFPKVQAVYAEMKAKEDALLEQGEPPVAAMTAGRKVLDAAVKKLGFADYGAFSSGALLPSEFAARKAELGHVTQHRTVTHDGDAVLEAISAGRKDLQKIIAQLKKTMARLAPVLERNEKTAESSRALTREAEGIGLTAMNVSLKAVQLGEVGLGTGVIAGYLGEGARSLRERVTDLGSRLQQVSARLNDVVVEAGWGELEYEMVLRAFDEVAATHARGDADRAALSRRVLGLDRLRLGVMGTRARMQAALTPFLKALQGIDALSDAATEQAIGLGAAHVGGRVESARLPSQHSMEGILGDLRVQLDTARARLVEIKDSVTALSELRAVMADTEKVVLEGADALERHTRAIQRAFDAQPLARTAA